MVPGDHGTTYGGNPLATAAICEVFHQYDKLHILDHVNEIAPYLTEKLETLAEAHPDKVKEVRGLGLMQGMELTIPAGDVVAKALQAGVVLISAGTNIIRFVPPLIVEKEHIDKMINVLDDVLSE
jgi:acetylornithine/N-succinyldiaminopimelate aminotransferase